MCSLLIAALVSLGTTGLAQPHAIFLAVAVASPSTLYLWYLGVRSLFSQMSPISLECRGDKSQHLDTQCVRALSWFALLLHASLIAVANDPWRERIQGACSQDYLLSLVSGLLASSSPAFQCLLGCVWLQISHLVNRRWPVRELGPENPNSEEYVGSQAPLWFLRNLLTNTVTIFSSTPANSCISLQSSPEYCPDIVTWTEELLTSRWSPLLIDKYAITSIVGILQLQAFPSTKSPFGADCPIFLVLLFGLWRIEFVSPSRMDHRIRSWKDRGVRALCVDHFYNTNAARLTRISA